MPQEQLSTPTGFLQVDGRYVCADNLRFACILAIIVVHSSWILTVGATAGSAIGWFQFGVIAIAKFGTIGFFLISGFLLEKNLHARSSLELMERRIRKVFVPWALWFALTCALLSVADVVRHKRAFLPDTPWYLSIGTTAAHTFASTSFWFVPNLLLCLLLLLVFRRYLEKLWFGGVLLAISLFYSLNIYTQWIDAHHTRALFGFIFICGLGIMLASTSIASANFFTRFRLDFFGWLLHFPLWRLSARDAS